MVGVDRSADAVALAARRADRLGLRRAQFCTGLAESLDGPLGADAAPFDAAVGRFVLEHLPDPVAVLRETAARVRRGGVIAFLEYDFTTYGLTGVDAAWPPVPVYSLALQRVTAALAAAHVETRIGCKLRRISMDAGLPEPAVTVSGRIDGGRNGPAAQMVAVVSRSLLPVMERAGIATAAEVDVDTLADRIREAAAAVDASLRSPDLVGAWCTLPER